MSFAGILPNTFSSVSWIEKHIKMLFSVLFYCKDSKHNLYWFAESILKVIWSYNTVLNCFVVVRLFLDTNCSFEVCKYKHINTVTTTPEPFLNQCCSGFTYPYTLQAIHPFADQITPEPIIDLIKRYSRKSKVFSSHF